MPMPINRRGSVLLFEDKVQPSCFAEKRMGLRDLSLLVCVTIYLEGCLRFGKRERVRGEGKRVKGRSEWNTNLAIFVRFANVDNWASTALVLFTAHDGEHRA